MLKKSITYTDYNGLERTETFYFNLSKAELLKLNINSYGSYGDMLQMIVDSKDAAALMSTLENIILSSYGKKSEDGRRFEKSPELSNEFAQSEAYSVLLMELITDDTAATNFVKGLMPQDLIEQVDAQNRQQLTAGVN